MANMTRRRTVELPDHPDFLWVADQKPKKSYDVIIIGAGGHGLATAYYLAKNHGITNVAVIEKNQRGARSKNKIHEAIGS